MSNIETKEIDRGYKRMLRDMTKTKGSFVDVGLFGGDSPSDQSIVQYGLVQEFGTGEAGINNDVIIPPRSFLRSTVDEGRIRYQGMLDIGLQKITIGGSTAEAVLTKLGITISNDTKRKITTLKWPPNKPSTIRAKKSSNPLIKDGHLRQAITYGLGKVFSGKLGSILSR